ncbi:YdcF family protein [Candidatus Pacearchaeota archaeon]|nr:YdcF family protein [Candidatus Pacearchaeota archaeon]
MNTQLYDVIIPLADENDGDRPSWEGRIRLEQALRLYWAGFASKIVMHGECYGLNIGYVNTLAEAQKRWALQRGVPRDAIITEELSRDTVGEAVFLHSEILAPNQWKSALIVSSDYHMRRVQYIFNHILGPEYHLGYIGASTEKSIKDSIHNHKTRDHEQESLAFFLANIGQRTKPGDHIAIMEDLLETHPYYAHLQGKGLVEKVKTFSEQ